jgi:phosphatidylserine/phosphatidylglycerophosphate/cardiolipin synthase-like enzyme
MDKKTSQSALKPLLKTLTQDPLIQAYFNQSQASVYTEPYRQQTRLGDDLEQILIDTIKTATSTIDVAVQEFRLPQLAEVLVNRHQAGVKVRIILENNYSRPWSRLTENEVNQLSEQERDRYLEFVKLVDINQDGQLSTEEINQRDALVIINNAKIPWIDDTADGSKGSGLMHHKFVIVDGKTIILTSANFTLSDIHGDLDEPESRGNANNLLKVESDICAVYYNKSDFNKALEISSDFIPKLEELGDEILLYIDYTASLVGDVDGKNKLAMIQKLHDELKNRAKGRE